MKILKTSLCAVALSLLTAPVAANAGVLGIDGEEHSSIGIYIYNIKADTLVFASEAQRNLCPASIMKSLTSATALSLLGKNHRYATKVSLRGTTDSNGVFTGIVNVEADGDPTLESRHFKKYNGFTDSIAAAMKRRGITAFHGQVTVSGTMAQDGPVQQWQIDDVAWSYGAGIYRFNWRDNTFQYNGNGTTTPRVPGLKIVKRTSSGGTDLVRGIWDDTLYAFLPSQNAGFTSTVPHPDRVFGAEMKDKLSAYGIKFTPVPEKELKVSGKQSVLLYTHYSAPLSDILRSLMFRSDNMFAEATLLALAPGQKRSAAIAKEKKFWNGKGLATSYVTILDGSGLSRANRVSPAFMGGMLRKMAAGADSRTYTSLFPRTGRQGTVKSFLKGTRLEGRLGLKTGSMNGVQCYAGYAFGTDGTPTHVVVVMANSFYCSRDALRTAIANMLLKKVQF